MENITEAPLTRVVKLTLAAAHIDIFKQTFVTHKAGIAQMEGCISLQAYQDNNDPTIFFTISQWQNVHALDNYRYSDFFKQLWSTVKPMFTAKAEAHSIHSIG